MHRFIRCSTDASTTPEPRRCFLPLPQAAEALALAGRLTEEETKAQLAKLGGNLPEALMAMRDAKQCSDDLEAAQQVRAAGRLGIFS